MHRMSELPTRRVFTLRDRNCPGIGEGVPLDEVPFRRPQLALTGFWVGAAGSGLRQHACGGSQSAASGDSRNLSDPLAIVIRGLRESVAVLMDLDELVEGYW